MFAVKDEQTIRALIQATPSLAEQVSLSVTENPWRTFYIESGAGIAFQVYLVLGLFTVMGFLFSRWYAWCRFDKSLKISVPKAILGLEFIANILRLVYAVDPWFLWCIYPPDMRNIILTNHFVFSISACLLLVTFWLSVSYSPDSYQLAIRRLRVPFIILVLILIFFEVFADMVRVTPTPVLSTSMVTILIIAYVIVLVLLALYFLISGGLLLRKIRQSSKNSHARYSNKRIRKIIFCLIGYACFNIVVIVGLSLIANPDTFDTVGGNYAAQWIFWTGIMGSSICVASSIRRPKIDTSGSLSSETGTKITSHGSKPNILTSSANSGHNNRSSNNVLGGNNADHSSNSEVMDKSDVSRVIESIQLTKVISKEDESTSSMPQVISVNLTTESETSTTNNNNINSNNNENSTTRTVITPSDLESGEKLTLENNQEREEKEEKRED